MLKFDNISVFYGKKQVLFDISASIERGKFTAIIGRNGSGKSTLLSALTSQTAYSGKILLDGRDISSIDRRERAKMISFLPQNLPVKRIKFLDLIFWKKAMRFLQNSHPARFTNTQKLSILFLKILKPLILCQ